MDNKKLKVLKSAVKENKIKPIISTIRILEGVAMATELENAIATAIKDQDGLYDVKTGLKLNDKVLLRDGAHHIDIEEYPDINIMTDTHICTFDITELKNIIKLHKNFIADKETLACNGMHMVFDNNIVEFVTSNTYAMIKSNIKTKCNIEKKEITVKESTVKILEKILTYEKKGSIDLYFNNDQIVFKSSEFSLMSRTIELTFPDYNAIFNNVNKLIEIEANRIELSELIKKHIQISKSKKEQKHASKYIITRNKLELYTYNDAVEIKDDIDIITNDNIIITLNDRMISDYLRNIKTERVSIYMSSEDNIVQFNEDFVIMPIQSRD